ncbi:hypothetical protein Tco_0378297 [Tanacetum coccineum]
MWRRLSNDSLPRDGGSDVSLSAGADNDWYEVAEVAANDWYEVAEVAANDWYEVSADQWESATINMNPNNNQGPSPAGPIPQNPAPDLRTMEELCQPSMNGRGRLIAPVNIQATDFRLKKHMIQQVCHTPTKAETRVCDKE